MVCLYQYKDQNEDIQKHIESNEQNVKTIEIKMN